MLDCIKKRDTNKWKNILCQNDRYVVMANTTKAHKQDVAGEISFQALMKSECNNPIPTYRGGFKGWVLGAEAPPPCGKVSISWYHTYGSTYK